MTEAIPGDRAVASGTARSSAGAMLRAARQGQGLQIEALSASLKVPQAKLEALEADRYDELLDATFTRALAQSICRVLKIDPAPVLERLPSGVSAKLERVDEGLNTPLRERWGRDELFDNPTWRLPAFWLVLLCLAGAAAVLFTPSGWVTSLAGWFGVARERSVAAQAADSTSLPAVLPASALAGGIVERVNAAVAAASEVLVPARAAPGSGSDASEQGAAAAATGSGPATRIHAREATWVQVTDSRGQILLSRLLAAGETVGLDEPTPLRLRIGNARGTELVQRGQAVDLAAVTRDNVATVELR